MSTVLPGNEGSVISYIIIEPCLETSSNFKRKLASNLLKDICNDRTLQKSKNIKKHLLDRKADVGQGAQKTRPSGKMYLSHSEHKVRTCTKCRAAMCVILCTDQVCKAPLSAASFAPAAPNVHMMLHMCKIDTLLDAPVKCPLHKLNSCGIARRNLRRDFARANSRETSRDKVFSWLQDDLRKTLAAIPNLEQTLLK